MVIGGSTSGVSAGISAARQNVSTMIVEEGPWLGGMLTSAGVSAIDGNYNLPSGFWGEFKDSLINYYGSAEAINTGWVSKVLFEPSVGDKILKEIAAKEKDLTIQFNSSVKSINKKKGKWSVVINTPEGSSKTYRPEIIIDATELGDIARRCGVKYDVGMDAKSITKETIAPETPNDIIQDLTYVAILKDYGRDVTIEKPQGYDPKKFACSCQTPLCENPNPDRILWPKERMITYGRLPNNKYMINWPISGNDYYTNLIGKSEEERQKELEKAKNHTRCFIYFIQNELGMNTLGLADDEFPTEDKLAIIPYHRESLRIDGLVKFTVNHMTDPYTQPEKLYRTSIAVGDYPVDHHHEQYPNHETLPKLHFYPVPSFGLPLGVMIPKDNEGLIVAEKSISVSNIANGATRLQPVVLQIGQVAGVLAAFAVKNNRNIADASVREIQKSLLEQSSYLLPYLDVPKEHPLFLPLQRIGVTGILKGIGKNEGWSNQTWFRINDSLLWSELEGLKDYYPNITIQNTNTPISLQEMLSLIKEIEEGETRDLTLKAKEIYRNFELGNFNLNKQISRGEAAALIDQLLNPFEKEVTIIGNIKQN